MQHREQVIAAAAYTPSNWGSAMRRWSNHEGLTAPHGHLAVIRPRWEWRICEAAPSPLIERVSPRGVAGEVSEEICLLSIASPQNVKIRNGQLDVKLLEECRDGGLELWMPVFKQAFPVARRELSAVWGAWALCPARLARPSYTLAQFLDEVVAREPALHAVHVTKSRTRFEVLGCEAEHARIVVDGTHWDTFALEHEDHALIECAKAALGSALPPGTNYPAMLKRAIGITATPTLALGASI